jgi:hypothetical protein
MLYFKVISIYRGCVATCEKKNKKKGSGNI